MGIKIPPMHLGLVDTSEATQDCRLITHLTDRTRETGQLHLQICRHREGRRDKFCLDTTSHSPSLTEKLQLSNYADDAGNVIFFPHINLIGWPAIGDRPSIRVYQDDRHQRQYILDTIVAGFSASSITNLVRQEALLATV